MSNYQSIRASFRAQYPELSESGLEKLIEAFLALTKAGMDAGVNFKSFDRGTDYYDRRLEGRVAQRYRRFLERKGYTVIGPDDKRHHRSAEKMDMSSMSIDEFTTRLTDTLVSALAAVDAALDGNAIRDAARLAATALARGEEIKVDVLGKARVAPHERASHIVPADYQKARRPAHIPVAKSRLVPDDVYEPQRRVWHPLWGWRYIE